MPRKHQTHSRRLRRDVVSDSVNALNLVRDSRGDPAKHFRWEDEPISSHKIFRRDCTEGNDLARRVFNECQFATRKSIYLLICSLIAHDTDSLHWKKDGEGLADLIV